MTEYAAAIGQVRPNLARAQTVVLCRVAGSSREVLRSYIAIFWVLFGRKNHLYQFSTWFWSLRSCYNMSLAWNNAGFASGSSAKPTPQLQVLGRNEKYQDNGDAKYYK